MGEYDVDFSSKTPKRKWTPEEEQYVYNLRRKGYSHTQIGQKTGRSIPSIKNKLRRLNKKKGIGHYDRGHSIQKHLLNQRFIKIIHPHTILDLYNAGNTQYNQYQCTTNDINPQFNTDYHEDALTLIQTLYQQNKKYDMIDLDPYGTAYPLWKYAVQMINKGIIITLGELMHKRFKRYDVVGKYYGITCTDNFTPRRMVEVLIKDAMNYNVNLKCVYLADYDYIARAYFKKKGG